jgi:ATP-dependent Clp protease ATP-binding subunit ClpC
MKIELGVVVARKPGRLFEVWLPGLDIAETGTSMAALRDELALQVMQQFERGPAAELGKYQRAPHQRLRHVDVDTFVRGKDGRKRELKGRIGVLLEKWPGDDFWVAIPTRLHAARFAVRSLDVLEQALPRRLAGYAAATGLESLAEVTSSTDEKLELLEVDVYPPSILPRAPAPAPRVRPRRDRREQEAQETPAEREERRARARLGATALREVGRNLSHAADDETLGRAFGRDALAEQLVDEIEGRQGAALVLVGPSGVGKSALVHEVVRRLGLRHRGVGTRRDVWRVDGGRFIAGMKYVGQWEQRARKLAQELTDTGDVLFADDLASLVYAGRVGASDNNLARYLEPHLARGDLTILAESTPERLARVREETPTFAALFRVVHVPAMSELETMRVLLGVLREQESDESAGPPPRLEPSALETVLVAAQRFRPHEAFPGKAVRLLSRVMGHRGPSFLPIGVSAVHAALRLDTGLPDFVIGAEKRRDRAEIERDLERMIAGQPEAIDAVTDVVLTMQAGLGDPGKPLATLLFVGPTGVGKTETAKALARYLFGSADRLLRFDMSELAEPDSISRLVGQVGGPDGELSSALRAQPFRVVLFDEIEKAHPRVFDALLQLLGEGRITDASGRTANASAAVILLTSNLGVREAAARTGFATAARGEGERQHYLSAVRAFFRPELFNRIDRIVPFAALDRTALRVVVAHALADLLSRRGIQRSNVLVDVAPDLLDLLVEQAYDPRYGARPLRRLLERRLTVPLAHHLVTRRGDDRALVELYSRGDDIGISVRLLADAAPLGGVPPELGAGMAGLRAAVARLREELDRLMGSPAFAAGTPWAVDLLEERARIEQQVGELEEATAEVEYVEQVDRASHRNLHDWEAGHSCKPARGGLRPRGGFTEVPHPVRGAAVERQLSGLLQDARDHLDVLSHRVRAAEAGQVDRCTLVWECAGLLNRDALSAVGGAVPSAVLGPSLLFEVGEGESWAWRTEMRDPRDGGALPVRRMAASVEGPGVRELLAPLAGWGVLHVTQAGASVPVLVRIELVDGTGSDAIAARDERAVREREARRRSAGTRSESASVALRRETPAGPVIAVAAGLPAGNAWALAAAFARAARRAG